MLNNLRVASPCTADWDQMPGNDRVRHCSACNLNVYNLSAMTEREIRQLIDTHEGRLCGRLFQRADGTSLTQNCPAGLQAMRLKSMVRRLSRIAAAVFAVAGWGLPFVQGAHAQTSKMNVSDSAVRFTVTDPTGAIVAKAQVTLESLDNKDQITGITDDHGQLVLRHPKGGDYQVTISFPGFRTYSEQLKLRNGELLTFDVRLYVAATTGVIVEVDNSQSLISTDSTVYYNLLDARPAAPNSVAPKSAVPKAGETSAPSTPKTPVAPLPASTQNPRPMKP
jgi:hypothetical protein